jgi:hypothetical protein
MKGYSTTSPKRLAGGRQVLIAEENYVVLKPDLADFADHVVARLGRKIDA